MSHDPTASPVEADTVESASYPLSLTILIMAILGALLVDLHLWAVTAAVIYVLAAVLELNLLGLGLLAVLLAVPVAALSWQVFRMALDAERALGREQH